MRKRTRETHAFLADNPVSGKFGQFGLNLVKFQFSVLWSQ